MADFKVSSTLAKRCCEELYGKKLHPQRWYAWRVISGVVDRSRHLNETQFRQVLAISIIRKIDPHTRFKSEEKIKKLLEKYMYSPKVNAIVEQYKQTEVTGSFVLAAIVKASGYDRSSVYRLLPGFSCKEKYSVEKMQEMIAAIGKKQA